MAFQTTPSVRRRWSAVAIVAVAILLLSVVPLPAAEPAGGIAGVDKVAHALGYAVLGYLVARAFVAVLRPRLRPRLPPSPSVTDGGGPLAVALVAITAVVAYGFGIELLQTLVSSRTFEVADGLANAVGTVLAVGFWTTRTHDRPAVKDAPGGDPGD